LTKQISAVLVAAIMVIGAIPTAPAAPTVSAAETPAPAHMSMTAHEIVRDMGFGWNLGNTFDSHDREAFARSGAGYAVGENVATLETWWLGRDGSRAATQSLIKQLVDLGFGTIRIPVTWHRVADPANDWQIWAPFTERVAEVVDWAYDAGLYVIINVHHDEYVLPLANTTGSREGRAPATQLSAEEMAQTQLVLRRFWEQIGERFGNYGQRLIFEGLNEPRRRTNAWNQPSGPWDWNGSSADHAAVNRWNQAFVNAVRGTGGNNEYRHLMLATYGAQARREQLDGFALPSDPIADNGTSRFILSVHTYSPFGWAHNGNGSYGGDGDIRADLERVANRANALGIPVILGEWGSVARNEHSQRVAHAGDYVRIAADYGMRAFWWDDHGNFRLISRTEPIDSQAAEIIAAMTAARRR
jgi:endoglucanase